MGAGYSHSSEKRLREGDVAETGAEDGRNGRAAAVQKSRAGPGKVDPLSGGGLAWAGGSLARSCLDKALSG